MAILGASVSIVSASAVYGLFANSEQAKQDKTKTANMDSLDENHKDMFKKDEKDPIKGYENMFEEDEKDLIRNYKNDALQNIKPPKPGSGKIKFHDKNKMFSDRFSDIMNRNRKIRAKRNSRMSKANMGRIARNSKTKFRDVEAAKSRNSQPKDLQSEIRQYMNGLQSNFPQLNFRNINSLQPNSRQLNYGHINDLQQGYANFEDSETPNPANHQAEPVQINVMFMENLQPEIAPEDCPPPELEQVESSQKAGPVQLNADPEVDSQEAGPMQIEIAQAGSSQESGPMQVEIAQAGSSQESGPMQVEIAQAGSSQESGPMQVEIAQAGSSQEADEPQPEDMSEGAHQANLPQPSNLQPRDTQTGPMQVEIAQAESSQETGPMQVDGDPEVDSQEASAPQPQAMQLEEAQAENSQTAAVPQSQAMQLEEAQNGNSQEASAPQPQAMQLEEAQTENLQPNDQQSGQMQIEAIQTEATKELQTVLDQIDQYLPSSVTANNRSTNAYLKKRDSLINKVKQFLNNDMRSCLNVDARCAELLAEIRELSTEISMYDEMYKYMKLLNEISAYVDKYVFNFQNVYGGRLLPKKFTNLQEIANFIKNDYCMAEIFGKVKKIIENPDEIPFNNANSCENLIKRNSNIINNFRMNIENLKKRYLDSKKLIDASINRLSATGGSAAPEPAQKS